MRPELKSINVVPRSAGGKFPDGSPVLPTVHFEGSRKKVIPAHGARIIESAYYLRRIHSKDLSVVDELPEPGSIRANPTKVQVPTAPSFGKLERKG